MWQHFAAYACWSILCFIQSTCEISLFWFMPFSFLNCVSSKQKEVPMWSTSLFLKYSLWKTYHQKERNMGEKNHHYVLYMKKKFSLALLSVTELDIKYRLNANMFQWFRNDLRMEALCRVVCKVFSIFHILLLNCHLSCNNMYKTTERQEVIRIIHFCWEEVWFYCFSKSTQEKVLICFSLPIFFYNPDILQILGLVLIHHTYLWPMLDKK